MRAIDADHLKRWILSRVFQTQLSVADVIDQIDREDTIEPEIIRCCDCRNWSDCDESCLINNTVWYDADEFCSKAERKTDEID